MKRRPTEISAGSMADIAFLLLIFFLVSTTMDVDSGIMRKLPPAEIDGTRTIKKRNVLKVYLNSHDELMVKDKEIEVSQLKDIVKDYLTPRPEMASNTDYAQTKSIELDYIGTFHKSKGIISMINDRGTSYHMYIAVQNEIATAIKELRNELAMQHFGVSYPELLEADEEKLMVIRKAIPISVSEAEPVDFSL